MQRRDRGIRDPGLRGADQQLMNEGNFGEAFVRIWLTKTKGAEEEKQRSWKGKTTKKNTSTMSKIKPTVRRNKIPKITTMKGGQEGESRHKTITGNTKKPKALKGNFLPIFVILVYIFSLCSGILLLFILWVSEHVETYMN